MMKIACDRCLKVVDSDSREVKNDWLLLTTGAGSKFMFCAECSNVIWETMFNMEKDDENDE